nr:hypothetical protein GZ11A10_33 [uncultured archaeon GZfos11A10]
MPIVTPTTSPDHPRNGQNLTGSLIPVLLLPVESNVCATMTTSVHSPSSFRFLRLYQPTAPLVPSELWWPVAHHTHH